MADIIVRVPLSQLQHLLGDKATALEAFWRVSGKPKRLAVGDYIWFATADAIRAGAIVHKITDRSLEGFSGEQGKWKIVWQGLDTMWELAPPVTGYKIQARGFRYATEEEQAALRKRYAIAANWEKE